jgi:hypothetical protein
VKHLRSALVRALVFLLLVGLPTIVFDVVYWDGPLPSALYMPVEVAFRLTLACFVTAALESALPRPWLPILSFVAAFTIYALGYCETEYVNGVIHWRSLHGGLRGVSDLVIEAGDRPGYYLLLLAIVSAPFAGATFGRTRRLDVPWATLVTFSFTFLTIAVTFEPYHYRVGRVRAAFLATRTIFTGLFLPFVAWLGDRIEERLARARNVTNVPPE